MPVDCARTFVICTPPQFDLTQKNLLGPLSWGGSIVCAHSVPFDPEFVLATAAVRSASVLNCTPSALYALVEAAAVSADVLPRSLRAVVLGGEPVALRRLPESFGDIDRAPIVVNSYGPTECSDVVAFHCMTHADWVRRRGLPLGRPTPGVELFVVDEYGREAPVGALGELCIAGDAVGRGYVRRPALTAERFVPCPFASTSGTRMYRAGDVVRRRVDGVLEFIERRDNQVKIRGMRVELEEVEAALRDVLGRDEVAAAIHTAADGAATLVAFVARGSGLREQR
jgi:non-ribosomal peptide synthetase component F